MTNHTAEFRAKLLRIDFTDFKVSEYPRLPVRVEPLLGIGQSYFLEMPYGLRLVKGYYDTTEIKKYVFYLTHSQ